MITVAFFFLVHHTRHPTPRAFGDVPSVRSFFVFPSFPSCRSRTSASTLFSISETPFHNPTSSNNGLHPPPRNRVHIGESEPRDQPRPCRVAGTGPWTLSLHAGRPLCLFFLMPSESEPYTFYPFRFYASPMQGLFRSPRTFFRRLP